MCARLSVYVYMSVCVRVSTHLSASVCVVHTSVCVACVHACLSVHACGVYMHVHICSESSGSRASPGGTDPRPQPFPTALGKKPQATLAHVTHATWTHDRVTGPKMP